MSSTLADRVLTGPATPTASVMPMAPVPAIAAVWALMVAVSLPLSSRTGAMEEAWPSQAFTLATMVAMFASIFSKAAVTSVRPRRETAGAAMAEVATRPMEKMVENCIFEVWVVGCWLLVD